MQRIFQGAADFLDYGLFPNLALLDQCVAEVRPLLETKPSITVYGKACRQQRNVGFFSDESLGYVYSRQTMCAQPLPPGAAQLLGAVNDLLGGTFNGILVNEYTGGEDYLSAHSDSEIGLDPIGVVSISYGAERLFRVRNKRDKAVVADILTKHGCILHMGGDDFQKMFTHEIPVQKRVKQARISFSFRKHIV